MESWLSSHLFVAGTGGANVDDKGGHGMLLIISVAFMWRYHGFKAFAKAALLVIVFAMPRIMSGAHWFSDDYAGSLSIVCITCSWYLLSGASDKVAGAFERLYQAVPPWFVNKFATTRR